LFKPHEKKLERSIREDLTRGEKSNNGKRGEGPGKRLQPPWAADHKVGQTLKPYFIFKAAEKGDLAPGGREHL